MLLTEDALYCANGGAPIDDGRGHRDPRSHVSMKRGAEIGRFGLGFKSVLGVTKAPEFFSRIGSFRFNSRRAEERIREVVPDATRFPTLRLAEVVDPLKAARLRIRCYAELMDMGDDGRAAVAQREGVGLALGGPGASSRRVPAVLAATCRQLRLEDRTGRRLTRMIDVSHAGKAVILNEGRQPQQVARVRHAVRARRPRLRKDAGELADRDELPISWAAPLEGRSGARYVLGLLPDRVLDDARRESSMRRGRRTRIARTS